MYRILVVDDEPRVSAGIKYSLLNAELPIHHVETASNGFEALDCLRMDTYDLVLTDIQMSMMNGVELMEAILLEQPHLPVVVISAHEIFDFAKMSLRLGAKDYLIKPVDVEELIEVVGKVLQAPKEMGRESLRQVSPVAGNLPSRSGKRQEALIELVTAGDLLEKDYQELLEEIGGSLKIADCRYGIVFVHLNLSSGGFSKLEMTLRDRRLFKYASINILEESLSDWCGVAFSGFGDELICVIQLDGEAGGGSQLSAESQLNLIGQTIIINLKQYLNVAATVGISTLNPQLSMLPRLLEEAQTVMEWRKLHPFNPVLYYEDMAALDNLKMLDWVVKVDAFATRLKTEEPPAWADDLTEMTGLLRGMAHAEGLLQSCFGMLTYRLYGLLFDHSFESGEAFRHYDPDVYFRGLEPVAKLERLAAYAGELAVLLLKSLSEREQSVVSRICEYIQLHYSHYELKIQDIAAEVHFSAAYISYLFKKERNQNVWDYVSEVRIEEAKRLLAKTDMKRYEISYQVGYQSPEHFSRMFKRYTGMAPADYRKETRGN